MAVLDSTSNPNTPVPIWNTVLRFGGYCGLALVVYSLLSYLLGANPMSIAFMALNFFLALGITVTAAALAIKFQRDQLDGGFIGFGRALLIGFATTGIGVFISSIWNYILINFIDPGYIDKLKEDFMSSPWAESIPAEAMEQSMERFDKMADLGANLTQALMGALIMGLIAGLIAAAIMKRNPPVE